MTSHEEPATQPDWENPRLVGHNRRPARASFVPYGDPDAALTGDAAQSPWVLSLNGDWLFCYAVAPFAAPAAFEQPAFDARAWDTLPVPCSWQMRGHGRPHYTNFDFPFPVDPPRVPTENPTGSYRRTFAVPRGWAGKRIWLRFEGVDSAFHLWINGHPIGFSKGSRLPAEFDITDAVQPGDNLLAVPAVHAADLCVQTTYEPATQAATLSVRVAVGNRSGAAVCGHRVSLDLVDAEHRQVPAAAAAQPLEMSVTEESTERVFKVSLPHVEPWSAESPYLYTLRVTLLDQAGRILQVIPCRVGFRTVVIRDGQRRARDVQGREPSRARPRRRSCRAAGGHAHRRGVDEAPQRQCRAHLALSG